jgi:hypothetical protein
VLVAAPSAPIDNPDFAAISAAMFIAIFVEMGLDPVVATGFILHAVS